MATEAKQEDTTVAAARKTTIDAAKAYVKERSCTTFGQQQSAAVAIRVLDAEGFIDLKGMSKEDLNRLFYLLKPLTNSAAMARSVGFVGNGRGGVPDVSEIV